MFEGKREKKFIIKRTGNCRAAFLYKLHFCFRYKIWYIKNPGIAFAKKIPSPEVVG